MGQPPISPPVGPRATTRAWKVAEAAADAWRDAMAGRDPNVPLGVLAALALLGQGTQPSRGLARWILSLPAEQLTSALAQTWALFTIVRPELAFRCEPIAAWLDEEPRNRRLAAGAAAVARAAVRAGLLELPASPGYAQDTDVLGCAFQMLRSDRTRQALGEMYTPADIAATLALLTLDECRPGQSVCEPAAGTGGNLRALATALRQAGQDPHLYYWYACDINPIAVAALAVNVHLWDLGPRVVIGCADTLAEGNWEARAFQEQQQAAAEQAARARLAHALAACRKADALLTADHADAEHAGPATPGRLR